MRQGWIVDRLEQLGRSQAELARFMKMPAPRISEIISGRRKIQIDELPRLIEFLGVGSNDAMTRISRGVEEEAAEYQAEPPKPAARDVELFEFHGEFYAPIPVFDIRASGGPGALNEDSAPLHDHLFRLQWLRGVTNAPMRMLAVIQVSGDSMEPTLRQGDHILIDRQQTRIGPDGIYVYAQTGEGHLWVKRCQRSSKTKLITIRSDNPLYDSENGIADDDIEVIGRVIWVGRHIGG